MSQDHKVAPRPQKDQNWPNMSKRTKNCTFCSSWGSNSCCIRNQPLHFEQCTLLKFLEVKMASLDCKLLPDHNSVTTRPTHNVKNNQKITLEAPRLQKWLKSANHVKNNSATNHSIFHGSFACSFLAKIFYVATSTFSAIFYVEPKNNNYRLEPCIDSSKTRKDVDHGLQQIIPLSLILGLRNALTVSSPLCQLLCL